MSEPDEGEDAQPRMLAIRVIRGESDDTQPHLDARYGGIDRKAHLFWCANCRGNQVVYSLDHAVTHAEAYAAVRRAGWSQTVAQGWRCPVCLAAFRAERESQ